MQDGCGYVTAKDADGVASLLLVISKFIRLLLHITQSSFSLAQPPMLLQIQVMDMFSLVF